MTRIVYEVVDAQDKTVGAAQYGAVSEAKDLLRVLDNPEYAVAMVTETVRVDRVVVRV